MKRILFASLVLVLSAGSAFSASAEFSQKDRLIFSRFIEGISKMKSPDFSGFKEPEVRSAFGKVLQSGELDEDWFRQTRDRLMKKGILFGKVSPDEFTFKAKVYPAAYMAISDGTRTEKIILVPTYPPVIFTE